MGKVTKLDRETKAFAAKIAKRNAPTRVRQFRSWGWTRLQDYRRCPLMAKLKHLGTDGVNAGKKIAEPSSAPMQRGSAIGRLAEIYVKGKYEPTENDKELFDYAGSKKDGEKLAKLVAKGGMTEELERFAKLLGELRAQRKKYPRTVEVEENWAFTDKMQVTAWDDWNGCWLRIKVDVGQHQSKTRMTVIDWKTGKLDEGKREEYLEQLELYAYGAFHRHPTMEEVEVKLAYLDAGMIYPDDFGEPLVFTRAQVPQLKKTWDKRTRALLLDKAFAPRPNEKCRWCYYRKENAAAMPGGKALCKY